MGLKADELASPSRERDYDGLRAAPFRMRVIRVRRLRQPELGNLLEHANSSNSSRRRKAHAGDEAQCGRWMRRRLN